MHTIELMWIPTEVYKLRRIGIVIMYHQCMYTIIFTFEWLIKLSSNCIIAVDEFGQINNYTYTNHTHTKKQNNEFLM